MNAYYHFHARQVSQRASALNQHPRRRADAQYAITEPQLEFLNSYACQHVSPFSSTFWPELISLLDYQSRKAAHLPCAQYYRRALEPYLLRRVHMTADTWQIKSYYGYNPLDYIRYDSKRKRYSEQDIVTMAACLVPIEDPRQAIWEYHARQYLSFLIAYVKEALSQQQHTLGSVMGVFARMNSEQFGTSVENLKKRNPNSFAWTRYQMIKDIKTAERMHESIRGIISQKLDTLTFDGPLRMYSRPGKVDFAALGREKTAVFLNVSDTDRSADRLVNLFYTQALHTLCYSADKDYPDHRLPVPVRFILDDFAANAVIPDFDKITSVIRSREISVSIILQSLSQLKSIYGEHEAMTIINNCDNLLYLGGQDVETAKYISLKANKTLNTILDMPLDDAYLFTRGSKPRKVKKFELESHERYHELPESRLKADIDHEHAA